MRQIVRISNYPASSGSGPQTGSLHCLLVQANSQAKSQSGLRALRHTGKTAQSWRQLSSQSWRQPRSQRCRQSQASRKCRQRLQLWQFRQQLG